MGLDMASVNSTLSASAGALESEIKSGLSEDMDDQQLLEKQMQVSKWTLITNLQSNIMKTISESMKNTVSNIR